MIASQLDGGAWADAEDAFAATAGQAPPDDGWRRAPTPEQLARREYQAGIDSCIRVIANAVPGRKLQVFRLQAQEAFRLAALGGLDLQDVGDRLWGAGDALAGLDAELGDGWRDTLTAALAEAKTAALARLAEAEAAADAATASPAAPPERMLIVRRASEVAPERIE
jgi:hypothetical protein